jgi:hypothetical protein
VLSRQSRGTSLQTQALAADCTTPARPIPIMAGWSCQGQVCLASLVLVTPQRNARSRLVLRTPPAKCTQSAIHESAPAVRTTDLGKWNAKTSLGLRRGSARSRTPLSMLRTFFQLEGPQAVYVAHLRIQGRPGYKARRDSNRGRPTARKSRLKRLLQAVLKKYSAETLCGWNFCLSLPSLRYSQSNKADQ